MPISVDPQYSVAGFLVGLLVGQTGMGGGALMTPVLILLFGVHPATAVGIDLLYASVTKTIGTLVHGLSRTVKWRIVGLLASGSVPATTLTLLLISRVDVSGSAMSRVISNLLSAMLLLTALSLVFRRQFLAFAGTRLMAITPGQTKLFTVVTGAVLGLLVTISSVGAGAIGVTILLLLYPSLPMAIIVGSDIAHAVPLTLVAGVGHWFLGSVDWPLLTSLLIGSAPGVIIGSYLAARVPDAVLRPILAVTLVLVGGRLVF
jgi:uncharacterized protein